jgi:3-oxoacyl-[acyl-carrier protein] reductase
MNLGLENKSILITGSSRGIGRAIAFGFIREGAKVMVTGRNLGDVERTVSELNRIRGNGFVENFVGDLQEERNIRACIDVAMQSWGKIDVLVANIGSGEGKTGWEIDEKDWERLLNLNFNSGVRVSKAVIPYLKESKCGSIIFISSIAGIEHVGAPAPYEAAKAAILSYSKHLAWTLAGCGIRVNVVAPGNILFPGGTWDKKLQNDKNGTLEKIEQQVPLKRFGQVEEVADATLFLASPKASFITGACLVVDGGQTRSF